MNGTQIFALVTGMLSGLSLFMFGMNVMSDAACRRETERCH